MQSIILVSVILTAVAAAPGYLLSTEPHVYHTLPLTSKSTYTQNSQVIDHGSTYIHAPHTSVVPVAHAKSTVTKSNVISHGNLHPVYTYQTMPVHTVYHMPAKSIVVGHTPIVHTPVVQSSVLYHSSPLVTLKTGDSAITQQSSTVHETVPVVKSFVSVHN